MAEKLANPGVIGETYQDRKHPERLGVLESRNEKFKTLMFRDKEGNTFNIQYSTFRSQWRKYQGDEVLQTSSQKEAEAQKEEIEVAQAKENLAEPKKRADKNSDDRRKNPMSEEDLAQLQEDGAKVIKNAFDKAGIDIFELTQKFIQKPGQIRSTIKCGNKEIAEIWIMKNKQDIGNAKFFMPEEPFKEADFSKSVGDIEARHNTNPNEKRPNSFKLSTDKLELAITSMLKSLEPVYKDKVKPAKKRRKGEKVK